MLKGKRVLVTREKAQAKALSQTLERYGAIPVELPLIRIGRAKQADHNLLHEWYTFDWIIFTSQNGVKYFFETVKDVQPPTWPKVAAVGEKTAKSLQKRNVTVDLIPNEFVAESLSETLQPLLSTDTRVLLVKGNLARDTLREQLSNMADVTEWVVYETTYNEEAKPQLINLLCHRMIDVVTFTSSSTVHSFAQAITGENVDLSFVTIACIGPITKQTALDLGIPVHVCPHTYTIDAMIEELNQYFTRGE
ncbi:uroporphyrinogen-III synthase [Anoxybacillus suryakundensis]|uniref:Uroporphyrinogen-III synthase n=1 Tax=Anoxybacillus suryakundensis TaxID=1325335 RepID=A0A0K6GJ16_9BACL|nr:uroporphyrinogen-III synthase [Anoxybacillus suryakundensis]CUA78710.1 Uroporphyrinogen-III synthase [Anoxybacillus suryakundensis]